jgi:hypothetical protein
MSMDKIQEQLAIAARNDPRNKLQQQINELFFEVSKRGLQGWAYLANSLFYAIIKHESPAAARGIFDTSGPPPKALKTAIKNSMLLERLHRMKPKPNMKQLARALVEENKKLPRRMQRGAGGIDEDNMFDHIRRLEEGYKRRHAKWLRSLKR